MIHLPFTLTAYFFNALSLLTNKFLLQKTITEPIIYVFYISLLSILALLALPFTRVPDINTLLLSSLSALLWTFGAFFMFKALKIGTVSRVIPVIGSLIPLILLIFAFRTNTVTTAQTAAVLILISGLFFLTLTGSRLPALKEVVFESLSALLFAFSYIILRQAYLSLDFFSVLVWSRFSLVPFILFMLIHPKFRSKIFQKSNFKLISYSGLIFLAGQIFGTVSELLLFFSISLANPALVNSLAGTQYVFLFVFAAVLSKKYPQIFAEKYSALIIATKLFGTLLIGLGIYLLAF